MRDIKFLHPMMQVKASKLVAACAEQGIKIIICQTLRSREEQNALFSIGRRGRPEEKKVTNVSYPNSMHCWGLAFDIAILVNGKVNYNRLDLFDKVGAIGEKLGLTWGGSWKNFVDRPHFEMPGHTTKSLKAKYGTPEKFKLSWK